MVEALGYPLSPNEFIKLCTKKPIIGLDLSRVPAEHHHYYLRSTIDNLANGYVVQDEAPRLYDTLFRMIERGYIYRNPLTFGDFKKLTTAHEIDMSPTQELSLQQTAAQNSFLLAGLSGRGKTAMIESILSTIPQIIKHIHYQGQDFCYEQVVWLKVDVPTTRGQRALLWRILESLDSVTGEHYFNSHLKSNVTSLMVAVRKALIAHGVGIIVLDEAQNLSKPTKTEAVGNNENATLRFIEELFNKIGVPLLLVGTLSTLNLFAQEMTSARRIGKNGSLILKQCDAKSSFWRRFIKQQAPTELLQNQQTDLDTLTRHIHKLSAGIPAIASSLIRSTMSYLTYLSPKNQDLSVAALNQIFNEQFNVLSGALRALKNGQYYQFEDCAPLILLHESEDYLNSEVVAENLASTNQKKTLSKNTSQLTKLNEKQLKMLDDMSPESLILKARENE
ncbi:ATP-binding protein [Vibrio cyclitrophicus 1F53]|uniref:ATP-binding protein n=1 Tax=Vibrio cyclitrophicus TaxID=47951 RepID=UPI001F528390|nr:ATP-binding protein [Vibrio cyclitrophicus]